MEELERERDLGEVEERDGLGEAAARAGDATFNFLFARAGSSATTTLCTPALCAALQQYLDITPGASTFVDVAADA